MWLLLLSALPCLVLGQSTSESSTLKCGAWLPSWSCHQLKPNYLLHWRVNGSNLQFAIEIVPPAGWKQLDWVGLGYGEAGGMPGSDVALMRRSSSGIWVLEDRWASAFQQPALDLKQDKKLLYVSENKSGKLRAYFSVPISPCDTTQDVPVIRGVASYVIYAYGQGPFAYHGTQNRGEAVLTFIPAIKPTMPSQPTAALRTLQVTASDDLIPPEEDSYVCEDFEFPGNSSTPFHMTGYKGIISSTKGLQANYVHHMVLYNCTGKPSTFGKGRYRCEATVEMCSTYVAIWTPGSGVTQFPPEAGFRLGSGGGIKYGALQIHYNNVNLEKNIRDSSGIKFTYTPQLRPHDMGVLVLGWEEFQVPALTTWTPGPSVCASGCTAQFKAPLNIVRNLLHMHRIGYNMTTQHVLVDATSARMARPLSTRKYYNFKYQPAVQVAPGTVVTPGDALVTTCTFKNIYNTAVNYGFRTSEEMCYSYAWYWPQSATNGITNCYSSPLWTSDLTLCGNGTVNQDLQNLYIKEYQRTMNATTAAINTVQYGLRTGTLVQSQRQLLPLVTPYNPTPQGCPSFATQSVQV